MATILCAKSGVPFKCEHLPLSLSSGELSHPLFSVRKKKLLSLAGQWSAGKLSPTEDYLLYLSLLNSSDLLIWRSPAKYSSLTAAVIANSMESLMTIIGKIDTIAHPSFTLPKFAISPDTADLSNSHHWIQAWIANYEEWHDDYLASQRREKQKAEREPKEAALTRLIHSFNSKPQEVANTLANWAAIAGSFPTSQTLHPLSGKYVSLSDYWRELIRACVNEDRIFNYPTSDINELIDHCEDNITNGGIHSHRLFEMLRSGIRKKENYLDFGDADLDGATTSFRILSPESSAQDANMQAMILSAPTSEPKRGAYPSVFAFLKAQAKWNLAQQQKHRMI